MSDKDIKGYFIESPPPMDLYDKDRIYKVVKIITKENCLASFTWYEGERMRWSERRQEWEEIESEANTELSVMGAMPDEDMKKLLATGFLKPE